LLFDEGVSGNFLVYIDTQDPATQESERTIHGIAVAGLATTNPDSMLLAYQQAGERGRWPKEGGDRPGGDTGHWKLVAPEDIGFVKYTIGNTKKLLGFYFKTPVQNNYAVAVMVDGASARWGSVADQNNVRLRLIRHPEQESNFSQFPTAPLMMRHVYSLGTQSITRLELHIVSDDPSQENPDSPRNFKTSTYLHMFGLDNVDNSTLANKPDG